MPIPLDEGMVSKLLKRRAEESEHLIPDVIKTIEALSKDKSPEIVAAEIAEVYAQGGYYFRALVAAAVQELCACKDTDL